MSTVHKKHASSSAKASADAKITVDKTEGQGEKRGNNLVEPVVLSDIVTETSEKVEIIEEVTPAESTPAADPLTEFKEKMIEEEQVASHSSAKKNYMWPILFIFIIAVVLMVGIFIYKQGMNKGTEVNVVSLSPTPTIVPTATVAAIDLSKYEISILNGSGISGEASKQKESLEAKGFTVSTIGNAGNSDYTATIIQAKKEVDKAFLDKLKSVLESSFVLGNQEELPEDSDSDVIVILGSETN